MVSHPRPLPIARRASSRPAVLGLRRERAASAVAQLGGSAPLLIVAVAVSIQAGSALASAACWGIYIVLAKRAISHVEPLTALVGALAVSSLLLLPGALVAGGSSLWDGSVLATALAVAVLATALPYVLELVALKLVRASTFSVLLSLEPAVAALVGFALLGQRLGTFEVLAVVCVVVGSTAASRRAKTPPLT